MTDHGKSKELEARNADRARGGTPRRPVRAGLTLAALAVLACGREASAPDPSPPRPLAPAVGESPVDRPFVVFRERELRIERLEAPVPAPVSVGSRPSPETMVSDSPEVVSIDASGALVAHRPGSAVLRSVHGEGSSLAVRVEPTREGTAKLPGNDGKRPAAIRIQPAKARLSRGTVKLFEARSATGPLAAEWRSRRPEVVGPLAGGLFEGLSPGRTTVCARVESREVCADVEVIP